MQIKELFQSKKPIISFEIFPPKKDYDMNTIHTSLYELAELEPDFISVTYGAGGEIGSGNIELSSTIKNKYKIEVLPHLTCITAKENEIDAVVNRLKESNIENVLALRGDIPVGMKEKGNKYNYAVELIREIKRHKEFSIGAAAYPEGHIECEDLRVDAIHLKQKADAGADFLITQLFFDNSLFYEFLNLKHRLSIKIPISAGIMPILSKNQIQKMIFMCGVSLPSKIVKILYKYGNNSEDLRKAGMEYASEQVIDLIANGTEGIHIYTMNEPSIARDILKNIRPNRYNGIRI